MKLEPISTLAAHSARRLSHRYGIIVPKASATDPASIGARAPKRSEKRPMLTAKNIGRIAYSAMSTPTTNGVAWRCSAYSDTATRVPANTE